MSEIPITDEYLLYDLTKDAAGKRSFPGIDPSLVERYGRTIYPVTRNHVPFENHGVQPDQVHSFESTSFFWAPDSKWVVFADRLESTVSIVLVQVGEKDLTTLVRPISPADGACGRLVDATVEEPGHGLSRFGPPSTPKVRRHVPSYSLCMATTSEPAAVEEHPVPRKKPSVRIN